ncbi:MAG: 2-C-methyl-D-erythritol 4-phosphate cytidylyltransferase, partial [Acidobacteriota bacterium]|nr:2-C-methyl-D-erythritol 4-phosphate cytidylyltransferase [Acidobacteriota bacterium]
MSVWAVVVAGGTGDRFGGPKQFARLGGRPVLAWALEAARPAVDGVVLVVPAGRQAEVAGTGADAVVAGGPSRAASVRAGLAAVPADASVVVVHDGARPLASTALFRAVIEAVRAGADAAVPGLAVTDTVKEVAGDAVVRSLDRQGLVAVQTPQAFRAEALRAAHGAEGEATDDAALVERAGGTVRVVPGEVR